MQRPTTWRSAWRYSAADGVPFACETGDVRRRAGARRRAGSGRSRRRGRRRRARAAPRPAARGSRRRCWRRPARARCRAAPAPGCRACSSCRVVLRALPLVSPPVAKAKRRPSLRDLRDQLEQALVDAAELLGPHVAPVDAREAGRLAQPGEAEHGEEQRAVLELRGVERRALGRREDAGERGQRRAAARPRRGRGRRSSSPPTGPRSGRGRCARTDRSRRRRRP